VTLALIKERVDFTGLAAFLIDAVIDHLQHRSSPWT
jgi:hypothetical protein